LPATFKRSRKCLTAHLADVLISIRRRRVGAARKGNKASVDHLGFCGCQLAGTPANQYSVLVIHFFLLSSFLGRLNGPYLTKKPNVLKRGRARLTAHLADVVISIRRRIVGAERKGNKASID
jgi:hypothetical protein